MKSDEESDLESLKKDYAELQNKYGLPSFQELNEDFNIERISEMGVEIIIREVRRFIADKIRNYHRFAETLLNPTNASMLIFSIIKTLGKDDKEKLVEIYKRLSRIDVDLIELDIVFSEEKEAAMIRSIYDSWQEIKIDFLDIFKVIKDNWDKEGEKKNKNYFG